MKALNQHLLHHRCQKLARRDAMHTVSTASVSWLMRDASPGDHPAISREFEVKHASIVFRHHEDPIETELESWNAQVVKVSTSFGRRASASWLKPGPPKSQRALAVTVAEDLASTWIRPPDLEEQTPWKPPEPRERRTLFREFLETVTVTRDSGVLTIRTVFHFSHREPPGAQRGDGLSAQGSSDMRFDASSMQLLSGEGATHYHRYGREVGLDLFRLGPSAKPFSWS